MSDQGWDVGSVSYLADTFQPIDIKKSSKINKQQIENSFLAFFSNFRDQRDTFYYRELIRRQYNSGNYFVVVHLVHLSKLNDVLMNHLLENPTDYLPLLESALNSLVDEVTRPRPNNDLLKEMQVILHSEQRPVSLRALDSKHISKLVRVPGIIINASTVKAKATSLFLMCRNCGNTKKVQLKSGFSGYNLPEKCDQQLVAGVEDKCPIDPYEIVADKCTLVDQQVLKLQEIPEMIPNGELPRNVLLSVDRSLTNSVTAGSRVIAVGIFDIFQNSVKRNTFSANRTSYIRVVGFMRDNDYTERGDISFSSEDEKKFLMLSRLPNIYDLISNSISPSVLGSSDIKKAISCLLFGGSRKKLIDGMKLRGDINILLLGDPGTAKSQLLKYVEKLAPIAIYTSGKGSSAAGLTASVIRDPSSREFYLEAGAMVLADGGVACIDEFDKMRETDRVAIHEAMEQQTISIAKAAAANSTFGRWNDSVTQDQNIDFQATILSRFDCIFILKDTCDENADSMIAHHVIEFHQRSAETTSTTAQGLVDLDLLKKYISYCRKNCGPRLSEEAKNRLTNEFVSIRQSTKNSKSAIPITIRQLEAIVRISESISKMKLAKHVSVSDVEEALRLFRVSTLEAAHNGDLMNIEGMQREVDKDAIRDIERKIQRRFFIGANVSERVIIEDFLQQGYSESLLRKALSIMIQRGDLEYRYQRKVLHRIR